MGPPRGRFFDEWIKPGGLAVALAVITAGAGIWNITDNRLDGQSIEIARLQGRIDAIDNRVRANRADNQAQTEGLEQQRRTFAAIDNRLASVEAKLDFIISRERKE